MSYLSIWTELTRETSVSSKNKWKHTLKGHWQPTVILFIRKPSTRQVARLQRAAEYFVDNTNL